MEESDVQQLWDDGHISFWAVIQHYLNKANTGSVLGALRKLEVIFVLPRSEFKEDYKRLSKMAQQHGNERVVDFLYSSRGVDIKPIGSDKVYDSFFKTIDAFGINRFIAERAAVDSEEVKAFLQMKDLNSFSKGLEDTDEFTRSIVCYHMGLGNYPELIEVAMKRNSTSTLLGMAESGKDISTYFDKKTVSLSLVMEIYKRMLLYQHEVPFQTLRKHIDDNFVAVDERSNPFSTSSTLFNAGRLAVLDYGSRRLKRTILQREDQPTDVESLVVYNEIFNTRRYQSLVKHIKPFRKKLPADILEQMMDLDEALRYKVYAYTMDMSVFTKEQSPAVKKAKVVSSLEAYARWKKELHPVTEDLMKELDLDKSDLRKILPNNQSLKEDKPSLTWLYILLIVVLLLLSIAAYKYYKEGKSPQQRPLSSLRKYNRVTTS